MNPSDFLGNFYEQYAKSNPRSAYTTAKQSIKQGLVDPFTAAEEFAAKGAASGWKSSRIERGIRRLRRTPYGTESMSKYSSFSPLVSSTFGDLLGRDATPEEIQGIFQGARAARISSSDPGAFQSYLMDRLMTSQEGMGKIKTPEDVMWERTWGNMPTEDGYLQRGMVQFDPERFKKMAGDLKGVLSSNINISSNTSTV